MNAEEIVKRLRNATIREWFDAKNGMNAAADLIERQAKALEEAEKALEPFSKLYIGGSMDEDAIKQPIKTFVTAEDVRTAQAALANIRAARQGKMTGLWSQLTPEQQEKVLAYDGQENHGPVDGSFRAAKGMEGEMRLRIAPKGKIWRCAACGKLSVDRYGFRGFHSPGWDEACMLNSVLIEADNGFGETHQDADQGQTPRDAPLDRDRRR